MNMEESNNLSNPMFFGGRPEDQSQMTAPVPAAAAQKKKRNLPGTPSKYQS